MGPDTADTPARLRLGRRGVAVRAVGTVAALAVLAAGQVLDSNDLFPLGSLSQYATARDMNGTVRSVGLVADVGDEEVAVPLDQAYVGVGRAEVEGQLTRFLDDPSLLQALADARARLRPDDPPAEELRLVRTTRALRDGYVVGDPEVEELVRWVVEPQDAP